MDYVDLLHLIYWYGYQISLGIKHMTEPYTNGSLSIVIPMDDFKLILRQMWKSSKTEKKMGELYEKYSKLIEAK
tara:strand:+ start:272 stop:493 length:222 start_codon:yes stop_codon:yes gene_type:complete